MSEEFFVHIVGTLPLQNKLIMSLISNSFLFCSSSDDMSNLPLVPNEQGKAKNIQTLIMFDCWGMDKPSLFKTIDEDVGRYARSNYLVMFNVDPAFGIEKHALQKGVRGFLYCHDDSVLLQKMVAVVLNGEIWLPRRKLVEELFVERQDSKQGKGLSLTSREQDILRLLVEGKSNDKIAYELCVSIHTVKTHLYNLYKKIGVSNRTMASCWALRNL